MSAARECFIEVSKRFLERLDRVLASVDEPDDQWVHQTFDTPKREVEKVDILVKSCELNLGTAEERRLRIMLAAWPLVYRRVLNAWNTKDQLAALYARYQEGQLQHCNDIEDQRRKEALSVFEIVRHETGYFRGKPIFIPI